MTLTKNKFFPFFLFFVLVSGLFLAGVNQGLAVGAAYYPQDTTVSMTVDNFTIVGPSDADSVTTTATTVTVTISAGQNFTFKSANGKQLNTTGTVTSKTCTPSTSTVVINPETGVSGRTVVITPQGGGCDPSGSGGVVGSSSGSSGGGGGGGGTTVAVTTPTPTPALTPAPTATPVPSNVPQPTSTPALLTSKPTPQSKGFTSLNVLKLKDGDVISAKGSSDPDVYIVNSYGYKRLFLNPAIFGFYGHLGGFSKVKSATSNVRDTFVTSGLFRNCETNDKKVYGVETTGEDTGILHWVNTTGDQAVKDDKDFFKKVFCVNTKEFSWYKQGAAYTSVNQIPDYTRSSVSSVSTPTPSVVSKKYKVFDTDYLNVRETANTSAKILGKLPSGQIIESLGQSGKWHKIKYQNKDGWVSGDYLKGI